MRRAPLLLVATVVLAGCGSSYKGPKLVFTGGQKASVPGRATCNLLAGRIDVELRIDKGDLFDFDIVVRKPGTYPRDGRDYWGAVNVLAPPPSYELAPLSGRGSGTVTVHPDRSGSIDATFAGVRGTHGSERVVGAWICV